MDPMFIRTMKGTLPAVDKPQNDHTTWWLDSAEKGEPTDWSYRTLPDKNVLHGLQIGDIVRVRVAFRRGGWEKLYFQITKVDEYTKGNKKQRSVRKFCGIGLRVYIESAWDEPDIDLREGQEITFQRKNIIEVPGWSASTRDIIEAAKQTKRPVPALLCQEGAEKRRYAYVGPKGYRDDDDDDYRN